MRIRRRSFLILLSVCALGLWMLYCPSMSDAAKGDMKAKAAFDASKMSDMSDFNPAKPVIPKGDTIKIGIINPYSGPAAGTGDIHFQSLYFAVHDINKRGGIMVDGKKKLIEVIKGDTMSRPDETKKICERLILENKVQFLLGSLGSNNVKIMNEVANKYKIIAWNYAGMADDLSSAGNFSRYSFQVLYTTEATGRALAYYLGQIRKKEKKFYILNQDYGFGRLSGDGFKMGLKEYYPGAKIVGEEYHKLFLTDYAPYIEKIKASGADAVVTADFSPDSTNLMKQARELGLKIPFVTFLAASDGPGMRSLGIEGTKGMIHLDSYDMPNQFKNPNHVKLFKAWHEAWKKWTEAPFNNEFNQFMGGLPAAFIMDMYWLLSAIERAGTTNAEKLIPLLENDAYQFASGKVVKMRPCDHKAIMDLAVAELVGPDQQKNFFTIPPYYFYKDMVGPGKYSVVPAAKILPYMDPKLESCAGKDGWGE